MVADKIEGVKNVAETMSKNSSADKMDRLVPNKEHFDSLMNTAQLVKPVSFERMDSQVLGTEETHNLDKNPIFAEENVSSQKSGSATDQEKKRGQQQEEIEEVTGVESKKNTSTSGSSSLMDEVSKLNSKGGSFSSGTAEGIKVQAKDAISHIESVKTQLSQVQTEIKPSYQTLLRNRLSHIDDNLKIALNKAGIENTPSQQQTATVQTSQNPIHKFIDILTSSQNQLESLNTSIDSMVSKGRLSPAGMLAIQIKMTYVQQQIELFTNLLNKALESTKTIMNVQV